LARGTTAAPWISDTTRHKTWTEARSREALLHERRPARRLDGVDDADAARDLAGQAAHVDVCRIDGVGRAEPRRRLAPLCDRIGADHRRREACNARSYQLVRGGELPSIKLGRRVVVPRAALLRLVSREPSKGAGTLDRRARSVASPKIDPRRTAATPRRRPHRSRL
jgi:hypothetical protein